MRSVEITFLPKDACPVRDVFRGLVLYDCERGRVRWEDVWQSHRVRHPVDLSGLAI